MFMAKIYGDDDFVVCEGRGKTCWAKPFAEHETFVAPGATSRLSHPALSELVQEMNDALEKARAGKKADDVDIVFLLTDDFIVPVWGKCCREISFSEIDNASQMKILGITA